MLIITRGNPQPMGLNESPVFCLVLFFDHCIWSVKTVITFITIYLLQKDKVEGQGWVDNCTRIILERRHKPSTLIRNQEALLFWGVIHCKLYQQKYWQCLLDSSLPSGQAALKSSLPQQLLIYFFNNKPLAWALCLQTSDWMKSLRGRKFYLSQMTGQQLL